MLPYLEQTPLYNSCNFSLTCWYGWAYGGNANSTVWYTRINSFMCPSDGTKQTTWGEPMMNNYYGSLGTTTDPWNLGSTGIFANKLSYDMSNVSDGSSNTIAFGESLEGIDQPTMVKNRSCRAPNGQTAGRAYNPLVAVNGGLQLQTATLTALAACNTQYTASVTNWNRGRHGRSAPPATHSSIRSSRPTRRSTRGHRAVPTVNLRR